MKLLVTGSSGFVAGSVLAQAPRDWEIHAVSRRDISNALPGVYWHIRDDALVPGSVSELFDRIQPDALIHTAAIADIDLAERDQQLGRAVNVQMTQTLVSACSASDCKLVFCSTDTIFDGEHAPYREDDPPGPVNLYAETKVEAEQLVNRLGAQAVIARLSLVVGLPVLGSGNSFLIRMIEAFKEGRTVGMSVYEIRTPVDVITVGRALLELAASDHQGIFHLASLSRVSRLELARTVADRFGFSQDLVVAQPSGATVPGHAARPRDVSLDNSKARAELKTPMRTLDEGLSLILESGRARARV